MASEDASEVGSYAFCFNTWRRVRILGWMDFEARHGVAWGARSVQIEKSKEDVYIGSCREERSLKAKGSLGFREGEGMGSGEWRVAWNGELLI